MLRKIWKRNNSFYLPILLFTILGIGISLGLFYSYKLNISTEINLFDFFTLFVTIFLAVYISNVIEKSREVNKGIKDLFITRIDEIVTELDEFQNEINSREVYYQKVVNICKRIRKGIHTLKNQSTKMDFAFEENPFDSLNKLAKEIIVLSTDTPKKKDMTKKLEIQLEVKNNMLLLPQATKLLITGKLVDIRDLLFSLQVSIYSQ